jgi:murein DD-endopeptidase MepM/ murein hydrolase activator NlpD
MLTNRKIRSILFAGCVAFISAASAGDLYKWVDKDGIQHFSSTPPPSDESFDTLDMPTERRPLVTLQKLGIEREPEYLFINNTWGPVEVQVQLQDAVNVTPDPPLPARFVVPSQSEQRLLVIRATDPGEGFSYGLSYQQMIGSPLDTLPPEFDYYPPFPLGMEFPISQGFDNDVTHSEPPSQYAIDIVMPIGTPILAARGGRVMEIEDNFHGGGKQKRYMSRANLVRIVHDDGTMAVYAHLEPNSVRVQRGGKVSKGQWIANSGNTGYSSGPHLHFAIQLNAGMSLESLPFRFVAPGGGTMTPENVTTIQGVLAK